jgi:hypothetical protein
MLTKLCPSLNQKRPGGDALTGTLGVGDALTGTLGVATRAFLLRTTTSYY